MTCHTSIHCLLMLPYCQTWTFKASNAVSTCLPWKAAKCFAAVHVAGGSWTHDHFEGGPHHHNIIYTSPSTQYHHQNTIYRLPSTHYQQHTPILQHHLHITSDTTASSQQHLRIIIYIKPWTQQHRHNTITAPSTYHHQHDSIRPNSIHTTSSTQHITTPCMHEKGLILNHPFSSVDLLVHYMFLLFIQSGTQ